MPRLNNDARACLHVEIHQDTTIRKKFHAGFERTCPVDCLVIHGTGGPGPLTWMRRVRRWSERGKRYRKGIALFHYLVYRDGTTWNVISPSRWVHHASIGQRDESTIGIELENAGPDNLSAYTQAQYRSLTWLIFHLHDAFPEITTIISHNMAKHGVHGEGKQCPGPAFAWDRLVADLASRWTFTTGFEQITGIKPRAKPMQSN